MRNSISFLPTDLSPLDKEVIDLEKRERALTKPTTTLSVLLNTGARYSWAQFRLGWIELLKMIAVRHGWQLLADRVHDGNHVHLFVSAPPKVCVPEMVRVFKCVSAKLLFDEFPVLKEKLWVGICGLRAML